MEKRPISINIDTKTLFNIAWVGVFVFLLIKVRSIILILMTSVVIASFIGIFAGYLKKKININRNLAVALMYILTVAVFSSIFYFFVPVLIEEISKLLPIVVEYFPKLNSFSGLGFESLSNTNQLAVDASLNNLNITGVTQNIANLLSNTSSNFASTASLVFGGVANIILVLVISFYLSISKDAITNFLKIVTPIQNEEYVLNLWERSKRKIAFWMSGQVVLGVIIGLLTFIGLTILKVEYAVLLAVTVAIFELIPFGMFLAAIPAVAVAFGAGGISLSLFVIIFYVILQQLENYVIAPLIIQKATGISPLVVIISVLFGFTLAGFWGLILAIPVAVTLLEYIKDIEDARLKEMREPIKVNRI